MNLSGEHLKDLQQALLAAYPQKNKLSQMIRFDMELNLSTIAGDEDLSTIVYQLIEWAEAYGKLDELIEKAYKSNPASPQLKNFYAQWQIEKRIKMGLISEEQIRELINRLIEIRWSMDELQWTFKNSWSLPLKEMPESLEEMLLKLREAQMKPQQLIPVLKFVALLAKTNTEAKKPLLEWAAGIISQNEEQKLLFDNFLKQIREDDKREAEIPVYLLVKLIEETPYEEKYRLEAWLMIDGSFQEGQLIKDEPPSTLEEMESRFNDLIKMVRGKLGYLVHHLVIEMFLPIHLLDSKVEEWHIKLGLNKRVQIKHKYPLVLRSYERIDLTREDWTDLQPDWESKWEQYKRHRDKDPLLQGQLLYLCEECQIEEAFAAELRKQGIICLGLTFPPSDLDEWSVLEWVVVEGIPVAVWLRNKLVDIEKAKKFFKSLHHYEEFSKLPQLVYELRNEGTKDNNFFGNYLGLLWDNPERIPPDVKQKKRAFGAPDKDLTI